MIVEFRNEKVSNHGSIPITIDCNVVAFIVFEEGFHQPIKSTKQSVFLDDLPELTNSIVVLKILNPTDISLKETHFVVFLGVIHSKFLGVLLSSVHLHVPLGALLCHPRLPPIPDL
ncbi:hypothetical protein TNCV_4266491 [Trichonephila clavipes]|nr:hypothetical protein TNCV_4266491 [Trichonephila clavipes]